MNIKIVKSIRKTTVIKIDNSGLVLVKAPAFLSDEKIYDFINEKQGWINKKLHEIDKINAQNSDILAKKYVLINGNIAQYDKNYLKTLYIASDYLIKRTNYLANELGFNLNGVKIKKYKSRWGSCDKNKVITLNVMLMALDNSLIDYVIIHELCHTKYFNHQKEFHNLLNSILKNAKNLKKQINKYSYITKIKY